MRTLYRGAHRLAAVVAMLGALSALAAGFITCGDVVLRNLGQRGVLGLVDITQMLIMTTAFLTLPYGFLAGSHVVVEVGTDRLPRALLHMVVAFAALVGCALMAAIAYWGGQQAVMLAEMGDSSQTIGIPVVYYWTPLVVGSLLSALAALLVAVRHGVMAGGGDDMAAGIEEAA